MQDILDFINGVPRKVTKEELEALVQLGVKPISRDGLATCVLQELGDEKLGQQVFDDTSFDAVIANNTGTKIMFVTSEAPVPLYDTYCGDVVRIALREKYGVDKTFKSVINIATPEGTPKSKTPLEKLFNFWDREIHPPYWHTRKTEQSLGRIVVDTFHISGLPNERMDIPPKERLQSDDAFYQLLFEAYQWQIATQSGHLVIPLEENIRLQPGNWESRYHCRNASIKYEVDREKHYVEITVFAPEGEAEQEKIAELTKNFTAELGLTEVKPPQPFGY